MNSASVNVSLINTKNRIYKDSIQLMVELLFLSQRVHLKAPYRHIIYRSNMYTRARQYDAITTHTYMFKKRKKETNV